MALGATLALALLSPLILFKVVDHPSNSIDTTGEITTVDFEPFSSLAIDFAPDVDLDYDSDTLVVKVMVDSSVVKPRFVLDKGWADAVTISENGKGQATLAIDFHSIKELMPDKDKRVGNWYVQYNIEGEVAPIVTLHLPAGTLDQIVVTGNDNTNKRLELEGLTGDVELAFQPDFNPLVCLNGCRLASLNVPTGQRTTLKLRDSSIGRLSYNDSRMFLWNLGESFVDVVDVNSNGGDDAHLNVSRKYPLQVNTVNIYRPVDGMMDMELTLPPSTSIHILEAAR